MTVRSRLLIGALTAVLVGVVVPGSASHARAAAPGPVVPEVTVGSVGVWEGDAGTSAVSIPVDLSAPTTAKIVVQYSLVGESASSSIDFVNRRGSITFAPGAVSKAITVVVRGDIDVEDDERLEVHLTSAPGAVLTESVGAVTIFDDDADGVGPGIEVNVGDLRVTEANSGRHLARLAVTLNVPAPTRIKVVYNIECGTAMPGADYAAAQQGSITFAQGQQSKSIAFYVAADVVVEDLVQTFLESISVALGPAVVHGGTGIVDIVDNDAGTPIAPPDFELGEIRRASVSTDGAEAISTPSLCGGGPVAWGSLEATVSADGRVVAFVSDAANLVADDTNDDIDVFVRDYTTGRTERVSVQDDGSEFPPQHSVNAWQTAFERPSLSADGRFVSFTSVYSGQIYVRDRLLGRTELISARPDGLHSNGDCCMSDTSAISGDGRFVAFTSRATDLTPGATPGIEHVYLRDRQTATTTLVTNLGIDPRLGWSDFGGVTISADGRFVAFNDVRSQYVPGDTNHCVDVFVYDARLHTFERASVTSTGAQMPGMCVQAFRAQISRDGNALLFGANALLGNAGLISGVYVHNRATGTTTQVPFPVDGANSVAAVTAINGDGSVVAWVCGCRAEPGAIDAWSAWVSDVGTGEAWLVGRSAAGIDPVNESGDFSLTRAAGLSADGHVVAFETRATNLVPDDTNDVYDVFVQRLR
jgi:Tol biopolymer transport system component